LSWWISFCLVVRALCTTPKQDLHLYVVLGISSLYGETKQVNHTILHYTTLHYTKVQVRLTVTDRNRFKSLLHSASLQLYKSREACPF
jgi:hypothetical protein